VPDEWLGPIRQAVVLQLQYRTIFFPLPDLVLLPSQATTYPARRSVAPLTHTRDAGRFYTGAPPPLLSPRTHGASTRARYQATSLSLAESHPSVAADAVVPLTILVIRTDEPKPHSHFLGSHQNKRTAAWWQYLPRAPADSLDGEHRKEVPHINREVLHGQSARRRHSCMVPSPCGLPFFSLFPTVTLNLKSPSSTASVALSYREPYMSAVKRS